MESTNIEETWQFAEAKISYKVKDKSVKRSALPRISCSDDAAEIFRELYDEQIGYREVMYLLALDNSNRVISWMRLSEGGINGTVADMRMIIKFVLDAGAMNLIVSHNHPSGNLQPSRADVTLTQKVKKACEAIEITLHDHIIVTEEGYYSFIDEGLI